MRECKEVDFLRKEIRDEGAQKKLWAFSEKQIGVLERDGAVRRALTKKRNEGLKKAKLSPLTEDVKGVTMEKESQENRSKLSGSRRSRKAG